MVTCRFSELSRVAGVVLDICSVADHHHECDGSEGSQDTCPYWFDAGDEE